jgi:ATP-dependent exoDNAse (exonuclease V) beta subunit
MTRTQIKAQWDDNRDAAASAGTIMHANIENFYNDQEHHEDTKEWGLFCSFRKDHSSLVPYRSEMIVFAEDLKVAGSVDMIYKDPDDPEGFIVADWKRAKEIKFENKWQQGTHEATKDLEDTNFIHYSLQIGIYKYILQNYYNMKINGGFLVVLHPRQENYLRIDVKDLDDRVALIMEERRKEVAAVQKQLQEPPPKRMKGGGDTDGNIAEHM